MATVLRFQIKSHPSRSFSPFLFSHYPATLNVYSLVGSEVAFVEFLIQNFREKILGFPGNPKTNPKNKKNLKMKKSPKMRKFWLPDAKMSKNEIMDFCLAFF